MLPDTEGSRQSTTVLMVGAGAAGTLTAIALARRAAHHGPGLQLLLVDPAKAVGRGVAYSTADERHLLNVPADGMSAHPDDSGHFLSWLRRKHPRAESSTFAARSSYGRYLHDTLCAAVAAAPAVTIEHVRGRVAALDATSSGVTAQMTDGVVREAQAAVLAPGVQPPGIDWAPAALRSCPRFVADPWAPGALDQIKADEDAQAVLLVGTGLTAVDEALAADRPGRVLHAISRRGALPRSHSRRAAAPAPPEVLRFQHEIRARVRSAPPTAEALAAQVSDALSESTDRHGDWRWGLDALRPLTQDLWARLPTAEKAELLATTGAWWDVHRHRMAPDAAAAVGRMRTAGRL